jgi:hypothetical protein
MPQQVATKASASEIRRIIGDVDDAVVLRILETGASTAEILEAFQWTTADDGLGTDLGHARKGVAGEVYEILQSQDAEEC